MKESATNITVRCAEQSEEPILFNLMQKYLYEMTQFYDNTMNDAGNYEYKYLPCYFTEPARQAFFFYRGTERIGFALVNTHSFTGTPVDNCIAEFTIFPAYRKLGYGLAAVASLIKNRPGIWQLKYSAENPAGMKFWQKVCRIYQGTAVSLDGNEITVTFSVKRC